MELRLPVFLLVLSFLVLPTDAKASQQTAIYNLTNVQASASAVPHEQSQPNSIFSELISVLRQKTRVPLRLPVFVPYSEQDGDKSVKNDEDQDNLYAILYGADAESYGIQLAFGKDCEGGNACHVGELGGSTEFHDDYSDLPKIPVTLHGGIRGYFIDATCGAHCDDSVIYWSENGYYYSVALKAGSKEMLLQMANSAIETAQAQSRPFGQAAEGVNESARSAAATNTAAKFAAAARNREGMEQLKENDYEEAYLKFAEASGLDPYSALYANNAGYAQYKLEHYLEALQWYERAQNLDPARAVAYLNSADVYLVLERGDEARQAFQKYLALAPQGKLAAYARKKLRELQSAEP